MGESLPSLPEADHGLSALLAAELTQMLPAVEATPIISEQPLKPERDHQSEVRLNFVYCEHTANNAEAIAAAVGDAEVVAIELLGDTQFFKGMQSLEMSRFLRPGDDTPIPDYNSENLIHRLTDLWRGSGKEVIFVDIDSSHPSFELTKRSFEQINQSLRDAYSGKTTAALHCMEAAMTGMGQAMRDRELKVREQLETIVRHHSDQDIQIAVIQGATHTQTSYEMPQVEGVKVSSERHFVPQTEPGSHVFSYMHQASREADLHPNRPLDPDLLKRALLEEMVKIAAASPTYDSRRLVARLSDERVDELWQGVGRSGKSLGAKLSQKRGFDKVNRYLRDHLPIDR